MQRYTYFLGLAAGLLVYRSETIVVSLVGSHLAVIPVKSESNWPKSLGGVLFKATYVRFSIYLAFAGICSLKRNRFSYFGFW